MPRLSEIILAPSTSGGASPAELVSIKTDLAAARDKITALESKPGFDPTALTDAIATLQSNEAADDAIVAALKALVDAITVPDIAPIQDAIAKLEDAHDWVVLDDLAGLRGLKPTPVLYKFAFVVRARATIEGFSIWAIYKLRPVYTGDSGDIPRGVGYEEIFGEDTWKDIDLDPINTAITTLQQQRNDLKESIDSFDNALGVLDQNKADKTALAAIESDYLEGDAALNRVKASVSFVNALDTRIAGTEAKNMAQDSRLTAIEGRFIEPDLTPFRNAGGNTFYWLFIPDRAGAYPDNLSFRLKDRRAEHTARVKTVTVPFTAFQYATASGWTTWVDTAFPVAIWQDVTMTDSTVYRIHLHFMQTPLGFAINFRDSHSGADNTYGAVDNIQVTYRAKTLNNIVAVPPSTTIRRVCNITANDGAVTVNGLANANLFSGTSGRIKVAVPAGQEISSVTCSSSDVTIGVADPVQGALEIALSDSASGSYSLMVIYAATQPRSIFTTFNAGTWVTFKTLQFTISASGNRSLQIRSASGSVAVRWIEGLTWDGTITLQTANLSPSSAQYLWSAWNFGNAGNQQTALIEDTTNNKRYRVTVSIGSGYLNNPLVVEDIS
jgi:hypothetical protein